MSRKKLPPIPQMLQTPMLLEKLMPPKKLMPHLMPMFSQKLMPKFKLMPQETLKPLLPQKPIPNQILMSP